MNPLYVELQSDESLNVYVEADDPSVYGTATVMFAFPPVGMSLADWLAQSGNDWIAGTWHPTLFSQGVVCTPKLPKTIGLTERPYLPRTQLGDAPTATVMKWPRLLIVEDPA